MNTDETTAASPVPVLAARRISLQDRYSMERLRDLSLEIYKGDVVALVGASEDGKRLLLRSLDLLEEPEGGNMEVNGKPVQWRHGGAARARRAIGMAFSRESIFCNLTVLENMTIAPLDVKDAEEGMIRERVNSLLKFSGLSGLAEEMPINLTAGQRRRLAIVRALALNPEILLVEDPGDKLSPEEKSEVYALLRALAQTGMTMLFSTRDLEFVREIATRVVFMADGMIREDGTVKEVLDHPKYDRTQAFVRKNTGFYRELNARAFDIYEFEGAIDVFAAGKLLPPEKRLGLRTVLKTLLVKMLFPRISRIVLMIDVDRKTGELNVTVQYPGVGFDPLTQSPDVAADAARAELLALVKSAKYHSASAGKNELTLVV
jgi:polar amino acid transport system ATP-binding protein